VVSVEIGRQIQFQRSGDTVPPDTVFTPISTPAEGSTVTNSTVFVSFEGVPDDYTDHFLCRLDAGQVSECSSPWAYPDLGNPLPNGPHTIEVSAVDLGGDVDPTPAVLHFTEDHSLPDTQIVSGPAEGSVVTDPSPTFDFSGSPADQVYFFQCKVDTGAFAYCMPPFTLEPLPIGAHTFEVRTVDTGNYVDPSPAIRNFKVADPPPPAGTGQTAGQVATSKKCKKIRSQKRRKKCTKRAKSRH
jgi:hypothetical protein